MKFNKPEINLVTEFKKELKKSTLNVLTSESDFLAKSLKKPKGSSKAA